MHILCTIIGIISREWMYLEPIFTSEDISRQLPLEAKKYGTMERIWRRIMSSAAACPKVYFPNCIWQASKRVLNFIHTIFSHL